MASDNHLELEELLLAISSRHPHYVIIEVEYVKVNFADNRQESLYRFPSQKDESRHHDIRLAVLRAITSSVVDIVSLELQPVDTKAHYKAELQEFCRGLYSNQTLRDLVIRCYVVDADRQLSMVHHVAEMLRVNNFLKRLEIDGIAINTDSAKLLAVALRENRALQNLHFPQSPHLPVSTSRRSAEGVQMLVAPLVATDPLGSNSVLQTLRMGHCLEYDSVVHDEAAKHLAAMLCGNSSLLELELSFWEMTSEGGAAIGRALATNTTLTTLSVLGCTIGADGVKAIAQHLAHHNSSLTRLDVSHIWSTEKEGSKAANALANMLRSNSTLTVVRSTSNRFNEEGLVELFESLATNTSLTVLDLTSCEVVAGDRVLAAIGDSLRPNLCLQRLHTWNSSLCHVDWECVDRREQQSVLRGMMSSVSPEAASVLTYGAAGVNDYGGEKVKSSNRNQNHVVYLVQQVWPPPNDDRETTLDVIFFHGFQFGKESSVSQHTWVHRDNHELSWPVKWLPEDLEGTVRVLLVSHSADVRYSNIQAVDDFGRRLQQSLVSSSRSSFGWQKPIVLVGHGYGGLAVKSLVVHTARTETMPCANELDKEAAENAKAFLSNLRGIAHYAVPHSAMNLGSFGKLEPSGNIQHDLIERLSTEFEGVICRLQIHIFAFGEGKPTQNWGWIVPYESAIRLSGCNNYKVEESDHLDITRPPSREHIIYDKLLMLLKICQKPLGDVNFALMISQLEGGCPEDYNTITELFLERNMIREAIAFLLDVLKPDLPEHAMLQTKVLKISLVTSPSTADSILAKGMFSHYDRPQIAELCRKAGLYMHALQVNPENAPLVVGQLLDDGHPKDFIKDLILSVCSLLPVEALVDECEKRNQLGLLTQFLEHLVSEGSEEVHAHNALGKIIVDTNKDPELFLTRNGYYDSKVIGKYCETKDYTLEVIAYRRGQCDAELVDVTNKHKLFKIQARYVVERMDPDLWKKVMHPEYPEYRKQLTLEVLSIVLPESKNREQVLALLATLKEHLPHELVELL